MDINKKLLSLFFLILPVVICASDTFVDNLAESPSVANSIWKQIKMFKRYNKINISKEEQQELKMLASLYKEYYSSKSSDDAQQMIEHIIDKFKKFKDLESWHTNASFLNFFVSPVGYTRHNLSPSREDIEAFNEHVVWSSSGAISPIRLDREIE